MRPGAPSPVHPSTDGSKAYLHRTVNQPHVIVMSNFISRHATYGPQLPPAGLSLQQTKRGVTMQIFLHVQHHGSRSPQKAGLAWSLYLDGPLPIGLYTSPHEL